MQVIISEPQATEIWDLLQKKWKVCNCPNTVGPHYEFRVECKGNTDRISLIPMPPLPPPV